MKPEFSEKLRHIQSTLSGLKADEAFFSIDEFGPFAIKAQPGRALVGPDQKRLVPQWQRSKGYLILTAAVELSSNQITHFYSTKKNTDEMIRMMQVLVAQYGDRQKLYLSWDAASWHVSKKLFQCIDEHNFFAGHKGPTVETAPLPARVQFLNVIKSIFSGMSRAVIQTVTISRWTTQRPLLTATSMSATPTSETIRGGLARRYGARNLDRPNFRNSTIVKIRGFVSTVSFKEVDCVPHAVRIAPGLRLGSPKNGNISYVGRRLSAISR